MNRWAITIYGVANVVHGLVKNGCDGGSHLSSTQLNSSQLNSIQLNSAQLNSIQLNSTTQLHWSSARLKTAVMVATTSTHGSRPAYVFMACTVRAYTFMLCFGLPSPPKDMLDFCENSTTYEFTRISAAHEAQKVMLYSYPFAFMVFIQKPHPVDKAQSNQHSADLSGLLASLYA